LRKLKFSTKTFTPKFIGRYEVARLINRAQLALSLGAVSNLRFSLDATPLRVPGSVSKREREREREKEKRNKEAREKKTKNNEDGSTTVAAILISAVGTIFRRAAIN